MASNGTEHKLVLYTNHACPWAHRAHIALSALGLKFEEHIIDLETPRTPEYLAINPRGLVPTLNFDGVIIPESGIVAQFLADAYPSGDLLPKSDTVPGAIERAQISFFVDAFISKVQSQYFALIRATTGEEKTEISEKLIAAVKKELEPILADAAPFFGGRSEIGLAEVNTGSFVLRLFSGGKYGLGPGDLVTKLEKQTPAFYKWAQAVIANKHVTAGIWDEENIAVRTKKKLASAKK